ncbi:MAG: DUF131 domain-containing protein [Candidatus Bathyarchaeia archaeon]
MGSPIACEVCGAGEARYVCRLCNRRVCERCLNPRDWTCLECKAAGALAEGPGGLGPWSLSFPLIAFLLSFALIFIGMLLIALSSAGGQGFGLIMIGPIPIILGTGSGIPWRALSAIALILSLAFLIYALMRGRRGIGA